MIPNKRPIKVLISKAGLDGHDRGAKVISLGLREEGMEIIYIGLRQTPDTIVKAAVEEGVDVIGISSLSGAHRYVLGHVIGLLKADNLDNVLVIAGGIIPQEDIQFLKEKGVGEIFGPGSFIKDIAKYIREHVK